MSNDDIALRLAQDTAAAADAWLRDPLDQGVYGRLVTATLRWRAYTQPMLEGTETAGEHHSRPAADPGTDREPSVAEVRTAGALLEPNDPQATLARLAGRPINATGPAPAAHDQVPAQEP